MALLGACGGGDDAGAADADDGPLEYEVDEPSPPTALRVDVSSAERRGEVITLGLEGTFEPADATQSPTTLWLVSVTASTADGACEAEDTEPFPGGTHAAGSTVTSTWEITCPGEGEVTVLVDPFGGALDDTTTRIVLR